jgi:hypothetical protein
MAPCTPRRTSASCRQPSGFEPCRVLAPAPLIRRLGLTQQIYLEQQGDCLHVLNIAEDDNIFPLNKQLHPDFPDKGTLVQKERFDPPGAIKLIIESHANGEAIVTLSGHFLTLETETSTHYFVRGGQNLQPQNLAFTADMREGVLAVFTHEDIPIIESQQRLMGQRNWIEAEPAILKGDVSASMPDALLASGCVRRISPT